MEVEGKGRKIEAMRVGRNGIRARSHLVGSQGDGGVFFFKSIYVCLEYRILRSTLPFTNCVRRPIPKSQRQGLFGVDMTGGGEGEK